MTTVDKTANGQQRRNRRIAMTDGERDEFLTEQRTCRLATVDAAGRPRVSPVWFVWDGEAAWVWSLEDSLRWRNAAAFDEVSLVVDAGNGYFELRGVELAGRAELVGADIADHPAVRPGGAPDELFGHKYLDGTPAAPDGRHGWVRIVPRKIVSWDFRKLASAAEEVAS